MVHSGRPYLFALLAALILILPTLANGSAFFYEDSVGYVGKAVGPARAFGLDMAAGRVWLAAAERHPAVAAPPLDAPMAGAPAAPPPVATAPAAPAPRYWIAGRSLIYGLTTFLLYAVAGFFAVAFVQALVIAVPLALLWMRCLGLSGRSLTGAAAILATATSLPLFVGLVMPDYAAALIALIPAMTLAFSRRLTRVDQGMLLALLAYAAMLHDSHIVVLAGMLAACAIVAAAMRRRGRPAAWPWAAALALVAALAMSQAYAVVARHSTGQPLLRLPHLTAHFAESPILSDYLARTCPANGFLLCADRRRLPMRWTTFLFGPALFGGMDYAHQRRLSEQQVPLLIALAKDRPIAVAAFLARDAVRQTVLFSYLDLDQARKMPFFASMPDPVARRLAGSALVRHPAILDVQDAIQRIVVVLSLPGLAFLAWRLPDAADGRAWRLLAAMTCVGVAGNGLACGLLAFPYDRFQARVIWLLPFLVLSGAALMARKTSVADPRAGGPFDA